MLLQGTGSLSNQAAGFKAKLKQIPAITLCINGWRILPIGCQSVGGYLH